MKKFGQKLYAKVQSFCSSERGEGNAVQWVIGTFVGLLLMIVVYKLFQTQINTFVSNVIFKRMSDMGETTIN